MNTNGGKPAWLAALRDSALEVVRTALGCRDGQISQIFAPSPKNTPGAYLPILGHDLSLYVGWTGSEASVGRLARSFLSMGAEDELLETEVADALGELVNILGGGVKRRMLGKATELTVGLPFYSAGALWLLGGVDGVGARVSCGDTDSYVVIYAHDGTVDGGVTGGVQ